MLPRRLLGWGLVAVFCLVITTVPTPAQERGQRGGSPQSGGGDGRGGVPDPVEKIVQLKSDLYYVPGAGANAVIRVTPEGLILIDTKNPGREIAAALVAQIKSISDLPVKYVLNTHHHPDHTGNNQTFVEQGATVIGLEKMKQLMITDPRTKDIPGPPTVTFPKDYTLRFGGAVIEAHFYGASHTGGDTVVYLPDKRFVMVSDTIPVANPTPGIGSVAQTLDVAGLHSFGGSEDLTAQLQGISQSPIQLVPPLG